MADKQVFTANVPSFDDLVKKYDGNEAGKEALKLTKIVKESELRSQASAAKVSYLRAQQAFEKSVITDSSSITEAAKTLEKAKNTFEFLDALYNSVFPNGVSDESAA